MPRGDLDFVVADLTRFTERQTAGLLLDIHANAVEDTPVDLGWARAGWVPAVGLPKPGPALTSPNAAEVASALGRQSRGVAEVLAYRLEKGLLFTSNGVPYITNLNEGTSAQAPAAFVQRAIRRAIRRSARR